MTVIQTLQAARQATPAQGKSKAEPAIEFARQSAKLAARDPEQDAKHSVSTQAVEARFITGQDPVIQTADGGRLPAVPLEEALKLNKLKDILEDRDPKETIPVKAGTREAKDGTVHGARPSLIAGAAHGGQSTEPGAPLRQALPPSKTNPLFPPLPMYGPPTLLRELQCWTFRISSWFLSLAFLGVIVLGSLFTCLPGALGILFAFATFRDPDKKRKFYAEEQRRTKERREREQQWETEARSHKASARSSTSEEGVPAAHAQAAADANGRIKETFTPTEGGPDPLVCDVGYYAREQGLDCETFHVQTEDGFIIELWHLYNPLNTSPTPPSEREPHEPDLFPSHVTERAREEGDGYGQPYPRGEKKYPVLLLHGLLQSSGAYCCTGESSLAFYLAKCGYDVWLGNNRCGFHPRHDILGYSDPRMWAWNIRQMGVMDLPALVSRVLTETGFSKCALIAHSQGTTQTMVALAKEQRPELGQRLSCVCLLAPAAYAGPLIGKAYFKFMRVISPAMFRLIFGIHSFIPVMMTCHHYLPAKLYGFMGYRVFSFLFNWSDDRWERALRDRYFQFAPVYVSAESMRWWLGRECFAKQKCILATRSETMMEDEEDRDEESDDTSDGNSLMAGQGSEESERRYFEEGQSHPSERRNPRSHPANGHIRNGESAANGSPEALEGSEAVESERGRFAWYDHNAPPMAFWVCGNDALVDGRRLLRRFERGREPHVSVVHKKIIDDYEHLDVIWAVDSLQQVGHEVAAVIWKTAADEHRDACRTPWLDTGIES